jgi:HD superfamily phosphohydrolase
MHTTVLTMYEIRDPIHGTIVIDDFERRVVDHPFVQRLRAIKQLGFVPVVYPGGVHDRFQHSLGVMHLAGQVWQQLRPSLDLSAADADFVFRVVRLAGLLHDVGHAPFSHTTETVFPDIDVFVLPDDWYRNECRPEQRQATHEDVSLAIIAHLAEQGVLPEDLARAVAAVLSPLVRRGPRMASLGPVVGIVRALISGELDCDRCDYLLRDSHFLGVQYGVYDLPRLLACLKVLPVDGEPHLGLDVHGVHALEGLLLARYHMFLQVYFHKTPPAFDYYLEQALQNREVRLPLHAGLSVWQDLRDDTVTAQLHHAAAEGGEWSRRIIQREPAKLVLRERMGLAHQENFLANSFVDALRGSGCHVFSRRSRQRFTKITAAGQPLQAGTAPLSCERRVLGRSIVEPVNLHSDLLANFNQPIDVQHTYVLREDAALARQVAERVPLP